ncbi:MAG: hypothetical protein HKP37_08220, partial [Boseongicola sp.]|nr:hypothetical protein [Boseongicola sp.]
MLARLFSFVSSTIFMALVVGVAVPGTHRFLWPEAYGLTEIAPNVWTDRPERAGDYLELAESAQGRVERFFGDTAPRGVLVLCASLG